MSIFKNQSNVRIQLETEQDITGALATKIRYKKPSDTGDSWTAIVGDTTNGKIYYDVGDSATLDETGSWDLWAYITFSDGRKAPGKVYQLTICEEGS